MTIEREPSSPQPAEPTRPGSAVTEPLERLLRAVTGVTTVLLVFCVVVAATVEPLAWTVAALALVLLGLWLVFADGVRDRGADRDGRS